MKSFYELHIKRYIHPLKRYITHPTFLKVLNEDNSQDRVSELHSKPFKAAYWLFNMNNRYLLLRLFKNSSLKKHKYCKHFLRTSCSASKSMSSSSSAILSPNLFINTVDKSKSQQITRRIGHSCYINMMFFIKDHYLHLNIQSS